MERQTGMHAAHELPVAVLYQDGHVCSLEEADDARAALYKKRPMAASLDPIIISGTAFLDPKKLYGMLEGPNAAVIVADADGKLEAMDVADMNRFLHVLKSGALKINAYDAARRVMAHMDI